MVLGTHVMDLGNHVTTLDRVAAREHRAVPFALNELIRRSTWRET